MKVRELFFAVALVAAAAVPSVVSAQDLKDRLKIHKERLPRPSHRLYAVHPRRLAVQQGKHRRQYRFLSAKQNHNARKSVRSVTHKLTTPHKH